MQPGSWVIPALHAIVTVAWFSPLVLPALSVCGFVRAWRQTAPPSSPDTCSQLLIQITTIGNHATVNWIIEQIRGYGLVIPYTIWVVIEEGTDPSYPMAGAVVAVPADFVCKARNKARALQYSQICRTRLGLDKPDVRLLFLDDDSLPTKNYIEAAYTSRYDLSQGLTTPRLGYGRLLSHMDNLRTINCITFCAMFQGFGHPIHVHGEGLCVRASVEAAVGWDYPIYASEDLVFGQMAAHMGFSWGFFWECIQITSPWSWKDFVTQRRRWLWGNIHAMRHVLPRPAAVLIGVKWFTGVSIFLISSAALVIRVLGGNPAGAGGASHFLVSLGVWLAMFGASGLISSSGMGRPIPRNSLHVLFALTLAWVTACVTVGVVIISLCRGNPRRFEVIRKTREAISPHPPTTANS